ncbi:MAG: hypothetical protein AAGG07_02220 [Planctomycetota bacterium]
MSHRGSPFGILGWAVFLACSWTWCIGMYFPVLITRDYGWPGFLAFLIPNAIGAGAMGTVLWIGHDSARFVRTHAGAVKLFALVTILFQAWFCGWLIQGMGMLAGVAAGGFVLGYLVTLLSRRGTMQLTLAGLVWLVTMGVFAYLMTLDGVLMWDAPPIGELSPGLLWLAPICVFGFLLCPYLDPTFHRANRALPARGGAWAFAIGFLVLFVPLVTLTYAARSPVRLMGSHWSEAAIIALGLHIAVQLGFTSALHARELRGEPSGEDAKLSIPVGAGLVPMMIGVGASSAFLPDILGVDPREAIYRSFMVFYGLLFPAYIWLIAIPTRSGHSGLRGSLGARKRWVWLGACALAVPFYSLGYLGMREPWLGVGLAIALLARLVLPADEVRVSHSAD